VQIIYWRPGIIYFSNALLHKSVGNLWGFNGIVIYQSLIGCFLSDQYLVGLDLWKFLCAQLENSGRKGMIKLSKINLPLLLIGRLISGVIFLFLNIQ
jgi:hypothetical protein